MANWSNCPYWSQCKDEHKHIMTYCDVQCSNPTKKRGGEMEYTKGKWEVIEDKVGSKLCSYLVKGDEPVAIMISRNLEQAETNAHLIAAAPDCHKELSGIVDAFERLGWSGFMAEMHRRLPQAKQALDKAKGGQ